MYTICWTDSAGKDHWERGSKERVKEIILKEKLELADEDVLIFPPEADDLVTPIKRILGH